MKLKIVLIFMIFFLVPSTLQAQKFEIQISYGDWTLSPFITAVERESEDLIRRELIRLMSPILPQNVFSSLHSDVELSASGNFLALSMWYNFSKANFSLGLKGVYFNFELPYSIYSEQSIYFLGYPLAKMVTQAEGKVSLGSTMISLLARWNALSHKRFNFALYGGFTIFPFRGDFSIDGMALIKTPLGDIEYQEKVSQSIKQLREWDEDIPSSLFSPSVGIMMHYQFLNGMGLFLDLSLSQGTFLSVGLFFSI